MRIDLLYTSELYELPCSARAEYPWIELYGYLEVVRCRSYAVGCRDVMVVETQHSQETVGDALRVQCLSLDLLHEARNQSSTSMLCSQDKISKQNKRT